MKLRQIESLSVENKRVFLRVDFNVPLKNGAVTDDTRIKEALPTINYLLSKTNFLCLASHLGRPKAQIKPEFSLEPVAKHLTGLLHREIVLYPDYLKEPSSTLFLQLKKNQIILLENLRFHPGEEANNSDFADFLMAGYDCFVNDAFGACHRAHASVSACAEKVSLDRRAAGYLVHKEVNALAGIMSDPEYPFTVVMGGAKVADKIGVILNLMNFCNNILIGGAMAYTFLKFKGADIGRSKVEDDKMGLVESIFRTAEARKVSIHLPVDHVAAEIFEESASPINLPSQNIPQGLIGLDIGEKTRQQYRNIIQSSQTVLWNGPMGVFEWKSFSKGTMAVAMAMAESSATTVVGGGDSVAAVNIAGVAEKITHISTGGGASLEFLEGRILPGLKVLAERR